MTASRAGLLADVLVVDLSRALAGPHASMMLGDLGARVIKVETPDGGDDTRRWGPPFSTAADGSEHSTYFLSANRNKESIALDLKSAEGRDVLSALIARADVLIENFRPGVLQRLGFDIETIQRLNPRTVILSITGFGHDGPEAERTAYDQIAQGEAGLMSLTGPGPDQPTKVGVPIADMLAGMYGVSGVLAALHERTRTGRGRVIRTSLLAAVVGVHGFQGARYTVNGEVGEAGGDHHLSICPYGLFHCADGAVQIAVGSDGLWRRLALSFGIAEPGWATNPRRVAERTRVIAAVQAAFAPHNRDDLLARLDEIGVPAGRIRNLAEVYEWDQTRSQGLLIDVEHAALGAIALPGPPLRIDGHDATVHRAPPTLDEHGPAIRAWLREGP
jgi:crotonobetainyl-CoA:carnitine CoA-transferase CaiB-like acyl-CoA transferase